MLDLHNILDEISKCADLSNSNLTGRLMREAENICSRNDAGELAQLYLSCTADVVPDLPSRLLIKRRMMYALARVRPVDLLIETLTSITRSGSLDPGDLNQFSHFLGEACVPSAIAAGIDITRWDAIVGEDNSFRDLIATAWQEELLRSGDENLTNQVWCRLAGGSTLQWLPHYRSELENALPFPVVSSEIYNEDEFPAYGFPDGDSFFNVDSQGHYDKGDWTTLKPEAVEHWNYNFAAIGVLDPEHRHTAHKTQVEKAVHAALGALPEDLIADHDVFPDVLVKPLPFEHALNRVFCAASYRGNNFSSIGSEKHYAALGRLLAWKTLNRMTGGTELASFAEVEKAAKSASWFAFRSPHNCSMSDRISLVVVTDSSVAVLHALDDWG